MLEDKSKSSRFSREKENCVRHLRLKACGKVAIESFLTESLYSKSFPRICKADQMKSRRSGDLSAALGYRAKMSLYRESTWQTSHDLALCDSHNFRPGRDLARSPANWLIESTGFPNGKLVNY